VVGCVCAGGFVAVFVLCGCVVVSSVFLCVCVGVCFCVGVVLCGFFVVLFMFWWFGVRFWS